jgi:polysaccharide biosynthesis transport protein
MFMTNDQEVALFGPEPGAARPGGYGYGPDPGPPPSHLRRFLEAPLRRPLLSIVPFVVILVGTSSLGWLLPKMYRSATLILVESDKMPDSFVKSMATEGTNKRLVTIQQEILSRTRMQTVLQELRPYPQIQSQTEAVDAMRNATKISVRGNDSFAIEYVHRDPVKAQLVTDRLATLFIEESAKAREEQVAQAYDFLDQQVLDARRELEAKDASIRAYKERHMGMLPEQTSANLATLQILQQEQQTVETALRDARLRQDMLERGLSDAGASSATPQAESADLAVLRAELQALRGRYTDEHPDVQSLKAKIARRERQHSEAGSDRAAPTAAVAAIRSQYEKLQIEVSNLEARRADLVRRSDLFHARVEQAPRSEQELATLTRDYQKLNESYLALLSKKLDAQIAAKLEKRWKGENFSILDPANLPEHPYSPNRPLLAGVGLLLGLIVGIGGALLAEYMDDTVKDVDDLLAAAPFPVLATIPLAAPLKGAPRALVEG